MKTNSPTEEHIMVFNLNLQDKANLSAIMENQQAVIRRAVSLLFVDFSLSQSKPRSLTRGGIEDGMSDLKTKSIFLHCNCF